jgi:hypothetical protein
MLSVQSKDGLPGQPSDVQPNKVQPTVKLSNGSKIVKRYRQGRCYACIWSSDSTEESIRQDIATGAARFYPYNEATGESATVVPCASIHCRHWDLAGGVKCVVQVERERLREQLVIRGVLNPCAWCDKANGIVRVGEVSHDICEMHSAGLMAEGERLVSVWAMAGGVA